MYHWMGRIFTTGLTIIGVHFQKTVNRVTRMDRTFEGFCWKENSGNCTIQIS